ncbi:unnamed protein product [Amoebophrya sp. A120]|nr:unnamed protein product [Amoebophrya sp. A120]|eukprot:GSA120T00026031001.1
MITNRTTRSSRSTSSANLVSRAGIFMGQPPLWKEGPHFCSPVAAVARIRIYAYKNENKWRTAGERSRHTANAYADGGARTGRREAKMTLACSRKRSVRGLMLVTLFYVHTRLARHILTSMARILQKQK